VAWWNAPTWRQSRDYLAAHPALLDAGTDVLIDEWHKSGMDKYLASRHLQLLTDARAFGIERAFAPLLAEIALDQWREHDYSSEYLTEHLDELLAAPVQAYLDARPADDNVAFPVLSAMLTLARRGEQAVVPCVAGERVGLSLCRPPSNPPTPNGRRACAHMSLRRRPERQRPRLAATALAIASALRASPLTPQACGRVAALTRARRAYATGRNTPTPSFASPLNARRCVGPQCREHLSKSIEKDSRGDELCPQRLPV
jgi:hypothetical protein